MESKSYLSEMHSSFNDLIAGRTTKHPPVIYVEKKVDEESYVNALRLPCVMNIEQSMNDQRKCIHTRP